MRETLDADHLSLVATSSPVSPEAFRSRRNSAASWRPRADGDFEAGNVGPSGDAWGAGSALASNNYFHPSSRNFNHARYTTFSRNLMHASLPDPMHNGNLDMSYLRLSGGELRVFTFHRLLGESKPPGRHRTCGLLGAPSAASEADGAAWGVRGAGAGDCGE